MNDNVTIRSLSESSTLQFKLVVNVLPSLYHHRVERQNALGGPKGVRSAPLRAFHGPVSHSGPILRTDPVYGDATLLANPDRHESAVDADSFLHDSAGDADSFLLESAVDADSFLHESAVDADPDGFFHREQRQGETVRGAASAGGVHRVAPDGDLGGGGLPDGGGHCAQGLPR